MDVVVRTPHGAADVAIRAYGPAATVQDLVRLVTGQAVPPVADLDGRTIETSTPLAAAGLATGSVVDTTTPDRPPAPPVAALLQLAGPGAGTEVPLPPGRYRLGPGRRLNADQLEPAPVEITVLELTVGDDGSVEARPGYSDAVRVNGRRIAEPTPWRNGMLAVGSRVFAVESPYQPLDRRRLAAPDARGSIAFSRPPRGGDDGPRLLVVDAVRDAVGARPTLWRQRPGDLTAFTVPIGLAGDPPGPITVDLAAERGVAVVGPGDFSAGLARTLLVEATTLHGPADLDLAVATNPDLLGRWDWAKWLPHLRGSGVPRFLTNETQVHEWIAQLESRIVDTAGQLSLTHLTLLVVDDPDLWTGRGAPLTALLSSPPPALRLLALAPHGVNVPPACTATIVEHDGGLGRLLVPDRGVDVVGVVPALTGPATATTAARHLAPLDDVERSGTAPPATTEPGPASLSALFHPLPTAVDGIIDRWQRAAPPITDALRMPLGISDGEVLAPEIGPEHNVLVTGTRPDVVAGLASGIVAAMAVQLPPDLLAIVHVATHQAATLDRLDALPHLAGRFGDPGAMAATRLIHRLARGVGAADPTERRVLVVVDDANRTAATSPGLTDGLIELADALPALQLLMTSVEDRRPAPIASDAFPIKVTVEAAAGMRRGSLRVDADRIHVPFAPPAEPAAGGGPAGLIVRPAVYGRPLTPLERRLDLLDRRQDSGDGDDETTELLHSLTAAAIHLGRAPGPSLVPLPLPPLHRSETLLAERPGDAIPLGLVDLPEDLDTTPLWWHPGTSMVLLGSPRSGVDAALSTIVLGLATRFSADDVHLYCIDPMNRRRIAAGLLPHAGSVLTPDDVDRAAELLDWLANEVERRRSAGITSIDDAPALLLLIHDLGQLRRHLTGRGETQLATIAGGAASNVNVVATAWRAEEVGAPLDDVADRLVGGLAERSEYEQLGVVDPSAVEGQLGRVWSTMRDRIVQLALPPSSLEAEVARLEAEPASSRPPASPAATLHGEDG